jgi:nucleotide-binding universal stress UspA family protein
MMESRAQTERIVVALDASPRSLGALRAAAQLAAQLQAELQALFVEDTDLLRLCDLPFCQEVSLYSTTTRRLDGQVMERQLRARAQSLQAETARVAEAMHVPWSFRVTRGSLAEELLAAAADAHFLSLARFEQAPSTPVNPAAELVARRTSRPILVLGRSGRFEFPLALLYTGSERSERALQLALRLGQQAQQALTIYFQAGEQTSPAVVAQIAQRLNGSGIEATLLRIADLTRLPAVIRQTRTGTLLLPADQIELLSHLAGPVLVVP